MRVLKTMGTLRGVLKRNVLSILEIKGNMSVDRDSDTEVLYPSLYVHNRTMKIVNTSAGYLQCHIRESPHLATALV